MNTRSMRGLWLAIWIAGWLMPAVVSGQVGVFSKEDLIAYTPEWKGERFPDEIGRASCRERV